MTTSLLLPSETSQCSEGSGSSCVVCSCMVQLTVQGVFDTRFGIPGRYDMGICASCGLEQLAPRPTEWELKFLYEKYYNFGGEAGTAYTKRRDRLFASFLYRLWTTIDGDISFHNVRGTGKLLDIGCNEGRGLELYKKNGFTPEGLELNENSAAVARQKGFTVYTEALESFYPEKLYDVVVLSNVLEHSLDPCAMLGDAARILRPGGAIWISCPNSRSWLRSAFGRYWINWHVPFHISFFSQDCLNQLLSRSGFKKVAARQFTPALWVASSLISRASAVEGRKTSLLRSSWLIPSLMILIRTTCFPLLFVGNQFRRGDCLAITAIRG